MAAFPSQEHRPLKKMRMGSVGPDVYLQDKKQKEVKHVLVLLSTCIWLLLCCCNRHTYFIMSDTQYHLLLSGQVS